MPLRTRFFHSADASLWNQNTFQQPGWQMGVEALGFVPSTQSGNRRSTNRATERLAPAARHPMITQEVARRARRRQARRETTHVSGQLQHSAVRNLSCTLARSLVALGLPERGFLVFFPTHSIQ